MACSHTLRRQPVGPRAARGALLIEVLVAILVFTFGILGMVMLQGTAVQQAADAQYRAEAAQLADELVGRMWAGDRSTAFLQAQYDKCDNASCAGYADWSLQVRQRLPGVTDGVTAPTVGVDDDGRVNITVYWRPLSNGPAAEVRRYDTTAQIKQ